MTDAELVEKKLAFIEDRVEELRRLAHPDQIHHDVREERFVAHTLQIAIQAALDVASHIVSDERLGEPESNYQLFELLAKHGWLNAQDASPMRAIVGFRNILVHGYQAVDLDIMRDVVENHLEDLLTFASAIRDRLPER
jgi:uncharacterized protein YutE (UPF0331/DUF86 family)